MDTERIGRGEDSVRAAANAAARRGGAWDGILAAAVIVALFALTVWAAAALPRALENAMHLAGGALVIRGPAVDGQHPFPRDIEEDRPEGPLAYGSSPVRGRGASRSPAASSRA